MELTEYIFAGHSMFTLRNENTGGEISYIMKWQQRFDSYIIYEMNEFDGSLTRIGYYNHKNKLQLWYKGKSAEVLTWFIQQLQANDLPTWLTITRFPYCARCGRRLKNEESLKRGYGDECAEQIKTNQYVIPFPVQASS